MCREKALAATADSGDIDNATVDLDYESIDYDKHDGRYRPQCLEYTYAETFNSTKWQGKSSCSKVNDAALVGTWSPHHDAGPDVVSGYAVAGSHSGRSQQGGSSFKSTGGYQTPQDAVTPRSKVGNSKL